MASLRSARVLVAIAIVLAMAIPALAAGVPACCVSRTVPRASSHACCAPRTEVTTPKGCCKAPEAPKPERRTETSLALAASVSPVAVPLAVTARVDGAGLAAFRIARREHRAVAPEDSPPDRLTRLRTLLI